MKILRLSACILAPLSMLALGYLFLMQPVQLSPVSPGVIAIVILEPVSPSIIDEALEAIPTAANLRKTGMCGTVLPGGSLSMEDVVCEILTGKDPRKLPQIPRMFNPDTYTFEPMEITNEGFLSEILNQHGRVMTRVIITEDGHGLDRAATHADLFLFEIPRNDASEQDYIKSIDKIFQEYNDIIDTWLVISPMHKSPVVRQFHINLWLMQNGYLAVNPDGTIDYAGTQAFYAGENEPGIRINRRLTYTSGSTPREDHEELMKELGKELRHLRIPAEDSEYGGKLVFDGIYRGADYYTYRHEGWYPDIEWEFKDEMVEIVAGLPEGLSGSPWVKSEEGAEAMRPGGWMCLWGASFDIIVDNEADLNMLLAADITPTVLFLLELPTAKDMQGRILQPLMVNSLQIRPPAIVDSYTFSDPFVEQ